jgi:ABC-type lipoprotein release transport system permease subunit
VSVLRDSLTFRIAIRNVLSYWRQSLAAIISIVAGFMAFVIFEGYLLDIYRAYGDFNEHLEMYGDLVIERQGASEVEGRADQWTYALTSEDQAAINSFLQLHTADVEVASRFLSLTGNIDTSQASAIFQGIAYDTASAAQLRGAWRWDTYWGKPLHVVENPEQQMIVGMRLARKLDCLPANSPGLNRYLIDLKETKEPRPFLCEGVEFQLSAMTESGQINAIDQTISGIQDKGFIDLDARHVVLSMAAAQRLFNTNKVGYYTLKLKPGRANSVVQNAFRQHVRDQAPHLKIISWKDHRFGEMYRKTLSLLDVIRNFLISIIIFIGAMSVFNTLVKMVRERTKEIGMLRSLGFRPQQVRRIFLTEALLLSWLGCAIGAVVALLLSEFFNQIKFTYPSGQFSFETPFLITINPITYIYGVALMSFIALLACGIAVRAPSKENIAQLLLHS